MINDDEWVDFPLAPQAYWINKQGDFKSKKYNKILSTHTNQGYTYVELYLTPKRKRKVYVHRAVAITFIPNPYNLPEVNHIDENKNNNDASNLEWCDRQYNCNHGTRNHRIHLNAANKHPILQYDLQGNFIHRWDYIQQASNALKIRSSGISNCCRGAYSSSGGFIWKYEEDTK